MLRDGETLSRHVVRRGEEESLKRARKPKTNCKETVKLPKKKQIRHKRIRKNQQERNKKGNPTVRLCGLGLPDILFECNTRAGL